MNMSNNEPGSSLPGVSPLDPRLALRRANPQTSSVAENSSSISLNTIQDAPEGATQDVGSSPSKASSLQVSSAGTLNTDPMKRLQDLMTLNYQMNARESECAKAKEQARKADTHLDHAEKSKNPYPATIEMLQSARKKAHEKYNQARKAFKTSQTEHQSLSSSFSIPLLAPPNPSPTVLASPAESSRITRIESDLRAHDAKITENSRLGQELARRASTSEQELRQFTTTFKSSMVAAQKSIEKLLGDSNTTNSCTNKQSLQLTDMNQKMVEMSAWIMAVKDGNVYPGMEAQVKVTELCRGLESQIQGQKRLIEDLENSISSLQPDDSSARAAEKVMKDLQPDISTLKTAIRSLECRYNNLTTEAIMEPMVHAMSQMYPNGPHDVALQLGQMRQQIERFGSTSQGLDAAKISDLEGRIQSCTSFLSSLKDGLQKSADDQRKMSQELLKVRKDMRERQNNESSRQTAFESFGEQYQEDVTKLTQEYDSIKLQVDDLTTKIGSIESFRTQLKDLSALSAADHVEGQTRSAIHQFHVVKDKTFHEFEKLNSKVTELLEVMSPLSHRRSPSGRVVEDRDSSRASLSGAEVSNGTGKRKRPFAMEVEVTQSTTPDIQSSQKRNKNHLPGS